MKNIRERFGMKAGIKTELFDYSNTEWSFMKENNPQMLYKILCRNTFNNFDYHKKYNSKNGEMYKTTGEYYLMVCVVKIFNCYNRKDLHYLINIFCRLIRRGCISLDIMDRINKYISQNRLPKFKKIVIKVMMNNYFLKWKKKTGKVIGKFFYPGVDNMILNYMF